MTNLFRTNPHNLYDFMKAHPELKLEVTEDTTLSVTFPENCSSKTLIMNNGNILFLQYAIGGSSDLFTYDASLDFHYYESLEKLLLELTK